MEYARTHGVPLMPLVTEGDLKKPVLKKYWKEGASVRGAEFNDAPISRIDMSKFALLENLFRTKRESAILPIPAVAEPPVDVDEEENYTHAERPPANSRDTFSGSEYVFGLSQCNFKKFLGPKDIAVVMFYDDENNEKTQWARTQLNKSARSTQRCNHGYAAINCANQRELCQAEGACVMPMYKIYSKGHVLSTIREVCTFTSDVMKRFVESAPILREPIRPQQAK